MRDRPGVHVNTTILLPWSLNKGSRSLFQRLLSRNRLLWWLRLSYVSFFRWIAERLFPRLYKTRFYLLRNISNTTRGLYYVFCKTVQISDSMHFRVFDVDFEIIICQTKRNNAEQFSPLLLLSRVPRPRTPSLFCHQQNVWGALTFP